MFLLQRISTGANPSYLRSNFMKVVPNTRYGKPAFRDALDQRVYSMMRSLKDFRTTRFDAIPLTTLSHKAYGTTSLWWLILMVNGYQHEMEIPKGTKIKIPVLSDIDRAIASKAVRAEGREVVII